MDICSHVGIGKRSREVDRRPGGTDAAAGCPGCLHQCRGRLHPEWARGASAKAVGGAMSPGKLWSEPVSSCSRWKGGRRSMTPDRLGPRRGPSCDSPYRQRSLWSLPEYLRRRTTTSSYLTLDSSILKSFFLFPLLAQAVVLPRCKFPAESILVVYSGF